MIRKSSGDHSSPQGENSANPQRYGGWLDLALQMALTLAISVLAAFFGGSWFDKQFDTRPWFTIIATLWGAGGGTAWVVLKVKQYGDAEEKRKKGTG